MNAHESENLSSVTATRRLSTLAALLVLCAAVPAQRFQYDYGQAPSEVATALVKVKEGYVIAGSRAGTELFGLGVDLNGAEVLEGRYAAQLPGRSLTPHCLLQTADGGFLASGEVLGEDAGIEVFLARFDKNGANVLINRFLTYRGHATGIGQGTRVVQAADGGFAVLSNMNPDTPAAEGVLFGTDKDLALVWWYSYRYLDAPVRFHDLCVDNDGSLLAVGSLGDPTSSGHRTLLVKTSPIGAPIWAQVYMSPAIEEVAQQAITPSGDGGFAIWGHFAPGTAVPGSFLLRVDASGGFGWRQHFPSILGTRPRIARAANGEYLCNGHLGNDALVLRSSANGLLVTTTTYGGGGTILDEVYQVVPTADGGFAAVGSTQLVDGVLNNAYVIKADATGDTCCNWLTVTVPRNSLPATPSLRRVLTTSNPWGRYVYVGPPEPCLDPTELCFEPACAKAPDALNLWLPFDEPAGPVAFNVLALLGMPNGAHVDGPTPVAGKVAGALSFDGVNDKVTVPDHAAADIGTEDFTLDAWIRPAAGMTAARAIVDKRVQVGSSVKGYSFFLWGTGLGYQLGVQLADGTHANYLSPVLPIVPGRWHFVAVRVDRDGASHFVLDDTSYPFTPSHPLSLANSAPFTVGQNSPDFGGARFQGEIDEVELFRRALTLDELRAVWRADDQGKCKEGCFLPGEIGFCHNQNTATINAWICNATTSAHTYTCWLQGLPGGAGCTIPGPTVFTPASPITVTVPSGTCQLVPVTVARPLAMTAPNLGACYEMMVVSDSGETFTCQGALRDRSDLCITGGGWDHTVTKLRRNITLPLGPVRVTNTSAAPIALSYRFVAVDEDGVADARVLSLDGLAPGTWPTGNALLQPNGSIDLAVDAEFVEYGGLGTYTVRLEADTDADGAPDYLGGRILRCDLNEGLPPVYTGVGAATSNGVPALTVNRNPRLGDAGFAIMADGLAVNAPAFFMVSGALASVPFPLALIGGQPGSFAYLDLSSALTIGTSSDQGGTAVLPMAIPDDAALFGATLYWQVFSLDRRLAFPLPLGNSNAMCTTIQ